MSNNRGCLYWLLCIIAAVGAILGILVLLAIIFLIVSVL